MLLSEILNKKVDYEVVKESSKLFITHSKIGDRVIAFEASLMDGQEDEIWEVSFKEIKNGKSTWSTTNSGNELEVFSMVKDSLLEFVERYKPYMIRFTADKEHGKDSRGNVYDRLIKRFKLPNYTYRRSDDGSRQEKFVLVRKD